MNVGSHRRLRRLPPVAFIDPQHPTPSDNAAPARCRVTDLGNQRPSWRLLLGWRATCCPVPGSVAAVRDASGGMPPVEQRSCAGSPGSMPSVKSPLSGPVLDAFIDLGRFWPPGGPPVTKISTNRLAGVLRRRGASFARAPRSHSGEVLRIDDCGTAKQKAPWGPKSTKIYQIG